MAITPLYTPHATQIEYARMLTAVYEPHDGGKHA